MASVFWFHCCIYETQLLTKKGTVENDHVRAPIATPLLRVVLHQVFSLAVETEELCHSHDHTALSHTRKEDFAYRGESVSEKHIIIPDSHIHHTAAGFSERDSTSTKAKRQERKTVGDKFS